jgi:hypothetical protein
MIADWSHEEMGGIAPFSTLVLLFRQCQTDAEFL